MTATVPPEKEEDLDRRLGGHNRLRGGAENVNGPFS
jgi:hypothetical protein